MRSEHTPGPWVWYEGDDAIESADGGVIAHVANHGNVNTIARTGETFSHANARLICASPRMYEYIAARAKEGDETAREILESIHATG